jgi:Flp pilus assembly protein TadD
VASLNATGEYEQSLKVIYKMLAYYPTDVYFLGKLAQVYERQKNDKLARGVYDDIIILDPANTQARSYLNR